MQRVLQSINGNNMTPQYLAKELIEQFMEHTVEWDNIKEVAFDSRFNAKQCALIALEFANEFADDSYRSCYGYKNTLEYLKIVKQEIEKL